MDSAKPRPDLTPTAAAPDPIPITVITVLLFTQALRENWPGGPTALEAQFSPGQRHSRVCLVRFMSGYDLEMFLNEAKQYGLEPGTHLAVGDQFHGPVHTCPGIRFLQPEPGPFKPWVAVVDPLPAAEDQRNTEQEHLPKPPAADALLPAPMKPDQTVRDVTFVIGPPKSDEGRWHLAAKVVQSGTPVEDVWEEIVYSYVKALFATDSSFPPMMRIEIVLFVWLQTPVRLGDPVLTRMYRSDVRCPAFMLYPTKAEAAAGAADPLDVTDASVRDRIAHLLTLVIKAEWVQILVAYMPQLVS